MLAITNEVDDLLTPSDFSPTPSFESFASTFNEGVPKGSAKDADAELAFYRAIVEHGKDFVHILSLRGRFLYVSRRATKRLLEYSEDELVGRGLSEFCHPADMLVVMRDMRNATSGEPLQLLYRFKRKRSGYIWLEARGEVFGRQKADCEAHQAISQATFTRARRNERNASYFPHGRRPLVRAAPWIFAPMFEIRVLISGPNSA